MSDTFHSVTGESTLRQRHPAMRILQTSLIFVLALSSWATCAQTTTVPFPASSPRPSATVVYCDAALTDRVEATHDAITATASRGADWRSHFRLMFKQHSVLLSVGKKTEGGQFDYEPPIEYNGIRDAPTDFAGNVYLAQRASGHLFVLAVNRDSGTATWTITAATGTADPYPWASTGFYICGPRVPKQ